MSQFGELAQVGDGLWEVSGQMRLMPGVYLPLSAKIIRLKSGGLLIHSPVRFSTQVAEEIEKLGEVEVLFAPNLFHNTFLQHAKTQFPAAALVAPLGMESKKKEMMFDELVGPGESHHLSPDFEHVFVQGAPKFNEVVLRHKDTSSLFVADYFFNFYELKGLFSRFVFEKFSDAYGRPAQSKLWQKMMDDAETFQKSASDVLALDFDQIHVSHGRTIENGKRIATEILAPRS